MITKKQKLFFAQSSQSGFTIIECLVAMVVVSALMAAIAPVVALSVGTRVQARRAELAAQAARAYADGIRSGAVNAPSHTVLQNSFTSVTAPTSTGSLACTTSATSYPYCSNTSSSSLYCIDLDGGGCSNNSPQDLLVQAFRTGNDQSYGLGLRVYRTDAFSDTTALSNGAQQATYTGGIGNRKAPLVVMTTEINTQQARYKDLCARLNTSGNCN